MTSGQTTRPLSVVGCFRIDEPCSRSYAQQFRDLAGASDDFDALTDQIPEQTLSCPIHEGEGGAIKAGPASRVRTKSARFAHSVNPEHQKLAFELDSIKTRTFRRLAREALKTDERSQV